MYMRRFAFFDREVSRGSIFSCVDVTCVTSASQRVVTGDSEGFIYLSDRDWSTTNFKGFKSRVNALCSVRLGDASYLIGVGDGFDARSPERRSAARYSVVRRREERKFADSIPAAPTSTTTASADGEDNAEMAMAEALGFTMPFSMFSNLAAGDDATFAGYNTSVAPSSSSAPAGETKQDKMLAAMLGASRFSNSAAPTAAASNASDSGAVIKVWRLDRRDVRTGVPELVKTVKVFSTSGNKVTERPVSALAVSEDMTQCVIGCADGTVLLFKGDLTRDVRSLGLPGTRSSGGMKVSILCEGATPINYAINLTTGAVPTSLSTSNEHAITFLAYTAASEAGGKDNASVAVAASTAEDTLADIALAITGFAANDASRGRHSAATDSTAQQASTNAARDASLHTVYIVSNRFVKSAVITKEGKFIVNALNDDGGASINCACMNDSGHLVTGNDEGVFMFTPEDKRAAYMFSGKKQALAWFRHHLIVASEEERAAPLLSASSTATSGVPAGSRGSSRVSSAATTLNVYDLRNKLIAFQLSLVPSSSSSSSSTSSSGIPTTGTHNPRASMAVLRGASADTSQPSQQVISFIIREWGQAYIYIQSSTSTTAPSSSDSLMVYQLREKDTGTKVDTLVKQQLFDTAAAVAQASGWDKEQIAEIHREHGEHLYEQGDYDGAIAQYIRTVDVVEPSYVIRKFLESQRYQNLTTYLEHLHGVGRATGEHTTLLLNCYTKLRQPDKLGNFITGAVSSLQPGGGAPGSTPVMLFDVSVAITALCDSACYDEALYLAAMHGEHEAFLRIQIEQRRNTEEDAATPTAATAPLPHDGHKIALEYIRRLPFKMAEQQLRRFGRALMGVSPTDTTELISSLCTRYTPLTSPMAITFNGQSISIHPKHGGAAANTNASSKKQTAQQQQQQQRSDRPETFLPLFVDHPLYLKRFLHVLNQQALKNEIEPLSRALWHAYLEVSLRKDVVFQELVDTTSTTRGSHVSSDTPAGSATGVVSVFSSDTDISAAIESAREEQVLENILKNLSASYDPGHALVLCQMYEFKKGCLYLYEKVRMYSLVLHQYMEGAELALKEAKLPQLRSIRREMVRKLKEWGTSEASHDPALWAMVLQFLTKLYGDTTGPGDDTEALFADVLNHIERYSILPPLRVIQIMAANKNLPFSLVQGFVINRLQADEHRIAEDSAAIASLRTETAHKVGESHRLDSAPVVFQQRTCAQCHSDLDLPSIHFLCGGNSGRDSSGYHQHSSREHSFHQHCVLETESGPACPICADDQKHIRDVRADILAAAGTPAQTEQFYTELSTAPDGFLKCAEFLGKSVFAAPADVAVLPALKNAKSSKRKDAMAAASTTTGVRFDMY